MESTTNEKSTGVQAPPTQGGGQMVVCFVSKQSVPRSAARQLKHPKAGLVWVSEQYIK
jgi:hypothetical protein